MDTPKPPGATILALDPSRPSGAPASPATQEDILTRLRFLIGEAEAGRLTGLVYIGYSQHLDMELHAVAGAFPTLQALGALETLKYDILSAMVPHK